jgi:hypothetical protein
MYSCFIWPSLTLLYFCLALWLVAFVDCLDINQTHYAHTCMSHVLDHLLHPWKSWAHIEPLYNPCNMQTQTTTHNAQTTLFHTHIHLMLTHILAKQMQSHM